MTNDIGLDLELVDEVQRALEYARTNRHTYYIYRKADDTFVTRLNEKGVGDEVLVAVARPTYSSKLDIVSEV